MLYEIVLADTPGNRPEMSLTKRRNPFADASHTAAQKVMQYDHAAIYGAMLVLLLLLMVVAEKADLCRRCARCVDRTLNRLFAADQSSATLLTSATSTTPSFGTTHDAPCYVCVAHRDTRNCVSCTRNVCASCVVECALCRELTCSLCSQTRSVCLAFVCQSPSLSVAWLLVARLTLRRFFCARIFANSVTRNDTRRFIASTAFAKCRAPRRHRLRRQTRRRRDNWLEKKQPQTIVKVHSWL